MTLEEAIEQRHSVRKYVSRPLPDDLVSTLQEKAEECNRLGHLHIQLVLNEPKAFKGKMAYGSFHGVENYFAMIGAEDESATVCRDERIGYYGEQLVLLAETLGLSTCWVGLTYNKVKDAFVIDKGETLKCLIALGYGDDAGRHMKHKTVEQLSNVSDLTPAWFRQGVEAASKAPSAINQQKYTFEYLPPMGDNIHRVKANRGFSLVGYTHIDLGIAKYHFEVGAGKEHFEWT